MFNVCDQIGIGIDRVAKYDVSVSIDQDLFEDALTDTDFAATDLLSLLDKLSNSQLVIV